LVVTCEYISHARTYEC